MGGIVARVRRLEERQGVDAGQVKGLVMAFRDGQDYQVSDNVLSVSAFEVWREQAEADGLQVIVVRRYGNSDDEVNNGECA